MSEKRVEIQRRPNNNFERIDRIAAKAQLLHEELSRNVPKSFKKKVTDIIDEIINIFKIVEETDFVPDGHRPIDDINDDLQKLIKLAEQRKYLKN